MEAVRFQMALHAYLKLTIRRKMCGTQDRLPDLLERCSSLLRICDVLLARTMTAFTIDTLGHDPGEPGHRCKSIVRTGSLRIRIVAEHAVIPDHAVVIGMIRQ